MAATKAIIEPLPVLSSAERYRPRKVDVRPKTWVQSKHAAEASADQLRRGCRGHQQCGDQQGTNQLHHVHNNGATITLNHSWMKCTGMPCIFAATLSMVMAKRERWKTANMVSEDRCKRDAIKPCIVDQHETAKQVTFDVGGDALTKQPRTTNPNARAPVRKMAIEVSPDRMSTALELVDADG